MPDNRDPMSLTLDALRSDVERTPLADSLTVRRRGDQRTRRAAIASAVAVVAVAAGVVGVAGGLTGDDRTLVNPPATGGPTVDTTPEPGPTTMDPPVTEVPDGALLTSEDLGVGRLAKDNVNAAGIETLTSGCLLGSDDLVDFGFAAFGPDPDGDPVVSQSVITQEDADAASRQLAGFRSDLDACEERTAQQPGASRVTAFPSNQSPAENQLFVELGDGAWHYVVMREGGSSIVIGFRTANATAILAFSPRAADEALTTAVAARARMTETFGA